MAISTVLAEPEPRELADTGALYRVVTIAQPAQLAKLRTELDRDGVLLLQKINRRDLAHIRSGTRLLVPRTSASADAFSPFPLDLEAAGTLGKLILVNQRVQAFAAYEAGRLVNWGPVSTGTVKQPTPNGLYHTNWKAPSRRSTINRNWMMRWYYNLHTSMGLALHQYALPGRPASYGCIRLLAEDARWIYEWAEPWIPSGDPAVPKAFGTPVVVFGAYDYELPAPWDHVLEQPEAARVSVEEAASALEPYLWVLEKRRQERLELAGASPDRTGSRIPGGR